MNVFQCPDNLIILSLQFLNAGPDPLDFFYKMSEKMAQFVIIPDPLIKVAIISFNV
jgi:hypothetical protein